MALCVTKYYEVNATAHIMGDTLEKYNYKVILAQNNCMGEKVAPDHGMACS